MLQPPPPPTDPFAALNDAQAAAVAHGAADGQRANANAQRSSADARALLVIAGAGTGKTMTLACRVARLVLGGADPERVLLLTFSRRAALEMERRVGHVLHDALGMSATQRAPALPWAGTFHSVGARLLRRHAEQIGLDAHFTVLDRADAQDLIGLVRHRIGADALARRFPLKDTCLAIHSRALNSQVPLPELLARHYPWCSGCAAALARLFDAYAAEKQRQRLLDYDDLLLGWWRMLQQPAIAQHLRERFDHLLVDEYQDTNRLQAAIVQAMKPDGRGVTVVGDDAQAIYGFRAAEPRNLLDFPSAYTPAARVVTLARNYRSTQPILDCANAVIAHATEGYAKTLWTDRASSERPQLVAVLDEAEQARWVAEHVLLQREQGLALRRQAVLFRTAHHSAALELELARRGIPFVKYGGLRFLEASHVKDALSVLRWVENPRNRLAGFRVAQCVPGIGAARALRLLDAMAASGDPVATLFAYRAPPAAAHEWETLARLYRELSDGSVGWREQLARVNHWLKPHLERVHDDVRIRLADLAQLAQIGAGFASRERFLTELTLDPPQATSDRAGTPLKDEDYLILSTIHSAKGQEWQAVYLLNVVDGCIPSDLATGSAAEIEEERRLLYVALTRARRHLHLLVPQRFYLHQQAAFGDRHVYATLTRFITPEVASLFEQVGPGAPAADGVAGRGAAASTLSAAPAHHRLHSSTQQEHPMNALNWFEIPVRDMDRAQTFYEALLGTPLKRETMGPQTLAVFAYEPGSGVGGCLIGATESAQPGAAGTLVYLNAGASLDATLGRVARAGGQIALPKQALPEGMGYFAHITDSEGNRVGLHALG